MYIYKGPGEPEDAMRGCSVRSEQFYDYVLDVEWWPGGSGALYSHRWFCVVSREMCAFWLAFLLHHMLLMLPIF